MSHDHLMDTVSFRHLQISHGAGPYLHSKAMDRRWLDFFTDVGTASLGYGAPQHIDAQFEVGSSGLVHSPILFTCEIRDRFAKLICESTGMSRVFFSNSGAESVEAAIKLARLFQWKRHGQLQRQTVWTLHHSFHGRTLGGLAAGDGPKYHNEGFGPLPSHFEHFRDIEEINPWAAAVMLSPVFGNNDVRPYPLDWLVELRRYTQEHGIVLIWDEVQTGSGRCGAPTYAQGVGIEPDIICLGKGVAMGAPMGVTLARGPITSTFTPGTHFSTFGGNPLCSAYGWHMWKWLNQPGSMEHVEKVGAAIEGWLIGAKHVKATRRVGALVAADLEVDTLKLAAACEQQGLLLGAFRSGPGPLKLTPPLNIPIGLVNTGMFILRECLEKL